MSCPAPEQLAAAATHGDAAILAHAVACERCLHALDDQRSMRTLAQRTPDVVLTRERREAMAAEIMAQADRLPAITHDRGEAAKLPGLTPERRDALAARLMAEADQLDVPSMMSAHRAARRRTVAVVVAGLAAAAVLVIVVATRTGSDARSTTAEVVAPQAPRNDPAVTAIEADTSDPVPEPVATEPDLRTPDPRTPESRTPGSRPNESRPSAKLAGSGDYARDAGDAGDPHRTTRSALDVVRLRGGEVTVDSTGSRPVQIVSGGTSVAVKKSRVKVIAIKGVVSSVAVFAGSAEVTVDGHRVIVEAGTVWERDVARDDALAAFRTGWTALRAGNNAEAIAAFDRATDPIVAEDATYWSAIASERAGNTDDAVRRYRELLARFPTTTRAAEARAAIARLAP